MFINFKAAGFILALLVAIVTTVTFQFNTWATKKELNDRIKIMKGDVQKDVDEKHAEVKEQIKQIQTAIRTVDGRTWEILKEVKKLTN